MNGFKIIALRILPECVEHIRKCLTVNTFYYLNNDYRISKDGKVIKRRSEFIEPLNADFFNMPKEEGKLRINISAIVGKNGDGKSTLIEIIIRMINNFAVENNSNGLHNMLWVKGVCAELYFQNNEKFYMLKTTDNNDGEKIFIKQYYKKSQEQEYTQDDNGLKLTDVKDDLFYTLISNYSHYAYNVYDYPLEWRNPLECVNIEDCWLHHVFHKNDGYQSPITIHPYRDSGNIDINREKSLSMQRLLLLLMKSSPSGSDNSFRDFNGKTASILRLKEIGYSKLQKWVLDENFEPYSRIKLLNYYVEYLKNETMDIEQRDMHFTSMWQDLERTYNMFIKPNEKFYSMALDWFESKKLLPEKSDISTLLDAMDVYLDSIKDYDRKKLVTVLRECWKDYHKFNLVQVQRLDYIDQIVDLWKYGLKIDDGHVLKFNITPQTIFKNFADMNIREKCWHYIIYKTISIFETYPSYNNPGWSFSNKVVVKGTEESPTPQKKVIVVDVRKAFEKLSKDWQMKSHITQKMRQTFRYIDKSNNPSDVIYEDKAVKYEHDADIYSQAGYIDLDIHKLSEKYADRFYDIDNMPPSVYTWEIMYVPYSMKDGKTKQLVSFNAFSSGEKQKLFSISAIIYHLLNIDSIATEKYHYRAINLILEEIELYFHPEWQINFIYELISNIRKFDYKKINHINIIFVTHSPYILSDIPKTNVLFLRNGEPDYLMQENTFGANINSLLKNGFFLPTLPIGEFAKRKINDLFAMLHSGDFNKEKLNEIKNDIMNVGEPVIRHQLLMLYKVYETEITPELIDKIIKKIEERKL